MRLAFALLLLALPAPAFGDAPTPRERGDTAIHARAILKKYCSECHNGQKSFDVLDTGQLTNTADTPIPWVNEKDPKGRSQVLEFVLDGSMPPGGRKGPTEDEIKVLKQWVGLYAPPYPKAFDDVYAMKWVLPDRSGQKEPQNVRYVSLGHRAPDGLPFVSLKADEDRLQAALDAATTKERVTPLHPVDPAATIYRIDIEKLGWATKGLFFESTAGNPSPSEHPSMIAYDLVRMEYPYLWSIDTQSEKYGPVLRGDWLADALAPGSPLAADLLSLVEFIGPGERKCGPKVRAFEQPKFKLIPPANTPITALYGPERASPFELTLTVNGKPSAELKVGEKYKLEAKSNIDAQFVLLSVLSDGEIRAQNVAGGNILNKDVLRELSPPNAKEFPAYGGLRKGETTRTEHFILLAAPRSDGMQMPTFLKTEQNTLDCPLGSGPISRFSFERVQNFDPSKVSRSVLRLTISAK